MRVIYYSAMANTEIKIFSASSGQMKFGKGLGLDKSQLIEIADVMAANGCEASIVDLEDNEYSFDVRMGKLTREQAVAIQESLADYGIITERGTEPERHYGLKVYYSAPILKVEFAHEQGRRPFMEDASYVHNVPPLTKEDSFASIKALFGKMIKATDDLHCQQSSTATVAHITGKFITVGYMGDSPAMLFVKSPNGEVKQHRLDVNEKDWKSKGKVEGLKAALQSFLGGNNNSIFPPYISQYDISKFAQEGDTVYFAATCDGLVENDIKAEEYSGIIKKAAPDASANELAKQFVNHAYNRGSQDNLTAGLVKIGVMGKKGTIDNKQDVMMAVFDGNDGRTEARNEPSKGGDVVANKAVEVMDEHCKNIKQSELPPVEVDGLKKEPQNGLGALISKTLGNVPVIGKFFR